MAPDAPAEAARAEVERLVDAAFDALEVALAQLRGRYLDRQRNAIDAGADPRDPGDVVGARLEAVIGKPATLDEEPHRRRLAEAVLRARIEGGDLVAPPAFAPERAAAGFDQEPLPAGRAELGDRIGNGIEHM